MAISTYCCLNRLPPPSPPSAPISRIPHLSCPPISKDRSWKSECLLSLTCAIVGLQIGDYAAIADQATAIDLQLGSTTIARGPRWSDRTACRPWRINSLETIVPENLPRPTHRRRLDAISSSRVAPPVKVVVIPGAKSCFSL